MTGQTGTESGGAAMAVRAIALLALWVVVAGADGAGLVLGAVVALLAARASLRLLPAGALRPRPAFLLLLLRLLPQAVLAGSDVARRALHPALPLHPGFIVHRLRLHGAPRALFGMLTGVLPGTVPSGIEGDAMEVHCLDTTQDVPAQLAAEEARLARALGVGGG